MLCFFNLRAILATEVQVRLCGPEPQNLRRPSVLPAGDPYGGPCYTDPNQKRLGRRGDTGLVVSALSALTFARFSV